MAAYIVIAEVDGQTDWRIINDRGVADKLFGELIAKGADVVELNEMRDVGLRTAPDAEHAIYYKPRPKRRVRG